MLKNWGQLCWLLRILLFLILLICLLNLDDVDGVIAKMGPRFARPPIASPNIGKYRRPAKLKLTKNRPASAVPPSGLNSAASNPFGFNKFIDHNNNKINKFDDGNLANGRGGIKSFGNNHQDDPNLPSTSAASSGSITNNGLNKFGENSNGRISPVGSNHRDPNLPSILEESNNVMSNLISQYEARRNPPSTSPKKYNYNPKPMAAENQMHGSQWVYPEEIFAGSHRDTAPVRVMPKNRNPIRKRGDENSVGQQISSTSNSPTNQPIQPGFLNFYKDATKINKKDTWKGDISDLAFGIIPENDEQYGQMLFMGSSIGNRKNPEDIAENMAKRLGMKYGVMAAKEGTQALISKAAENAGDIMEYAGPYVGAAVAPLIWRSVERGAEGYKRYRDRNQLPWQRNKIGQKKHRIGQYLRDFEQGTFAKATDLKNVCPYLVRCFVVGSGTAIGSAVGTAFGPPVVGTAVGASIGSKMAERYVSAPLEKKTRDYVRARQMKRFQNKMQKRWQKEFERMGKDPNDAIWPEHLGKDNVGLSPIAESNDYASWSAQRSAQIQENLRKYNEKGEKNHFIEFYKNLENE